MMTNEEARNILHPSTTLDALEKYSDKGRLDKIKIVEEACIVACAALDKLIEKPDVAEHKDAFEQAYLNGYAAALREERNG